MIESAEGHAWKLVTAKAALSGNGSADATPALSVALCWAMGGEPGGGGFATGELAWHSEAQLVKPRESLTTKEER